jgi:tRNA (cmo5U34)-methyltransferase
MALRSMVVDRMKRALRPGGAVVVFDKMLPRDGFIGTVNYRLTLAAKYEAGAPPEDIIAKELSISGLQRPMSEAELTGFTEVFRFGDFAGWVYEAGR